MRTAQEIINKAKVRILQKSPFFAYLSLYLKMKEDNKPENTSIGVTSNGWLLYNPKWVESLTDEEMIGVLGHEILHLVLLHLTRVGTRDRTGWNIATDLCINSMLLKEDFELPKNGLIPKNNEFTIGDVTIQNINEKIAEQIYGEIPISELSKGGRGGKGEGDDEGFDEHIYGEDENGKVVDESTLSAQENDWLNKINEAYIYAKERGKTPLGIDRYIDHLKKAQVNWKALLQKYLVAQLPNDYSWLKRAKKSMATKVYLPDAIKETIDVVVTIDTSGSIGKDELTTFTSEIVGIAKAYKSRVNMRLITHDTEIQEDLEVKNGNIQKIKDLKFKGGGGTEHKSIFDDIAKKYPTTKCVISFTDGYSDLNEIEFKDYKWNKIFIINKQGSDEQLKGKNCITIKVD